MIIQKKKSTKETIQIDNSMNIQVKNALGAGSSNESLGNPPQSIGKKVTFKNAIINRGFKNAI